MNRSSIILVLGLVAALGFWLILPAAPARAASCTWTGGTSTAWAATGNWSGCNGALGDEAPIAGDDVTLPDVTNDPVISTAVAINNLTLQAGGALTFSAGGSLSLTGNLVNDGSFTATGRMTTFSGSTNQSISGAGTTTFGTITVNNSGGLNSTVEVTSSNFNAADPFLTLTAGIFKLSGSFSLTNQVFVGGGSYTINAVSGFWLNNPNVIITGRAGDLTLQGVLRISAGTYNVGVTTPIPSERSLLYSGNSTVFIMEGGSLNITGRFRGTTNPQRLDFTMSGGTIMLATVVNTSTSATFDIFAQGTLPGSSFTMSGGSIILQIPSTSATPIDYRNYATTLNVTGGTVQFGNASTPASSIFRVGLAPDTTGGAHILPNLVINSANSPTVNLQDPIIVYGSVTINSGATLSAVGTLGNANDIALSGNWTQDGTFNRGTHASQTVTFRSATQQTLGGSSATTFNHLTLTSPVSGPLTLNIATVPYVNGTLSLSITNNRVILKQSQAVNATTAQFLYITDSTAANVKYRGVDITTAANLGTVEATVVRRRSGASDYCTGNTLDAVTLRCFAITAENPNNAATVTLWVVDPAELNGITYANLTPYHFIVGSGWQALTNVSRTTSGGYDGITGDTTSFSAFLLGGSITPTAITLRNLTAQSSARILPLLAAALCLALVSVGLWLYRQRKLQQRVVNRRG